MNVRRIIVIGVPAGLTMGIALFIVGAVAARFICGPQFVPEGKFEPEQINAWYFLWTKLVIGVLFGVVFTALYDALPLSHALVTIDAMGCQTTIARDVVGQEATTCGR